MHQFQLKLTDLQWVMRYNTRRVYVQWKCRSHRLAVRVEREIGKCQKSDDDGPVPVQSIGTRLCAHTHTLKHNHVNNTLDMIRNGTQQFMMTQRYRSPLRHIRLCSNITWNYIVIISALANCYNDIIILPLLQLSGVFLCCRYCSWASLFCHAATIAVSFKEQRSVTKPFIWLPERYTQPQHTRHTLRLHTQHKCANNWACAKRLKRRAFYFLYFSMSLI